jgi:hypothetical protein
MHRMLGENLGRWLRGSRWVIHLDFHTGLGLMGTWKLLLDYPVSESQRTWLTKCFGAGTFEESDCSNIAYDVRGGLGRWCVARSLAAHSGLGLTADLERRGLLRTASFC